MPGARKSGRSGHLKWLVLVTIVALIAALALIALPRLASSRGWVVNSSGGAIDPLHFTDDPPVGVIGAAASAEWAGSADASKVAAAMRSVNNTLNGKVTSAVLDLSNNELLWDSGATTPMTPASNIKLLVGLAVLDLMGPATTFETKVVSGGAGAITLVGGGDPMLSSSSAVVPARLAQPENLDTLASATAAELQAKGETSVTLSYDDSLFSGASWNPDWLTKDRIDIANISALWTDQVIEVRTSNGTATPSQDTVTAFAARLRSNGITVKVGSATKAGADAEVLASMHSAPLEDIVRPMMLYSVNAIAEILLRHIAIASGQPASFEGGTAALEQWMREHGLWQDGTVLRDGSGLARTNRISARTLVQAVALAGAKDAAKPELASVLADMPVARSSGTLETRYTSAAAAAGRGWVRAKTGTVETALTLTGYTRTAEGQLLAFSIMVDECEDPDNTIRAYQDALASALTDCGCS